MTCMTGLPPHAGHQRVLAPPARETVTVAFAKNWGLTLRNVITSSANKTTEHKVKMTGSRGHVRTRLSR